LSILLLALPTARVRGETSIVAWGANIAGQAAVPIGATNAIFVAAATNSMAVTDAGQVIIWGRDDYGNTETLPTGLSNVVAVALGGGHGANALALTREGKVIGWGANRYGEANVPESVSNVVAVSAGFFHSLVLTEEGNVVAWGYPPASAVPSGLTNVIAIAAGGFHNVALLRHGTIVAWGNNGSGQITVPPEASNVIAIAAGWYSSFAVRADGRLIAWGQHYDNQSGNISAEPPALITNALAVAAHGNHSMALRKDGHIIAWGNNAAGQINVPEGLSNVVAIATGDAHSLALVDQTGHTAWHLINPRLTGEGMTVKLRTERGRLYVIEKQTAGDPEWHVIDRLPGNGAVRQITIPTHHSTHGFLRARRLP
jgi:alpha-tubulin suppressor-like RCC1 family protein